MVLIADRKVDDLEQLEPEEQIVNLEGYISKVTKATIVHGKQEHNQTKTYWQKVLMVSNENLTKSIKVTIWDDLVHSYTNMQLYDIVKFKNVKLKIDNTNHNWGNARFVGSASHRDETEMQIEKTINFNFSKLQFKKLDDKSIYSNNYKAKVVKIVDETNAFYAKVATKQEQMTIRYWKNGNIVHEFLKIQKNKIYAFIGVWGTLEADNTITFSMYKTGRVIEI